MSRQDASEEQDGRADAPKGKVNADDDRKGHRKRLRERFDEVGGESFPDYELLELILFQVNQRSDTKSTAKALISAFGSFSGVLAAPREKLAKIEGVGPVASYHLKVIEAAAKRFARDQLPKEAPLLDSWSAVVNYLHVAMAEEPAEQFRILFLDKKNKLIAAEIQQKGTVDHTPVYPREVVKRALELSATALILAHNHPSGDPTPSRADIEMTKSIIDIAKPLGILVHDHIIVGRAGHASLRGLKLI